VANALKLHRRQIPLFFCLGIASAAWAYAAVDNHRMCNALEEASLNEVETYSGDYVDIPGVETATLIVASREYVLFGDTTGKVSVLFKIPKSDGDVRYTGIEFGYELREQGWIMTDSWGLHDHERVKRAAQAFGDKV